MTLAEVQAAIEARLDELKVSAAAVSKAATGQKDAIKRILAGHNPGIDRLNEVASTLGLEFYMGPARTPGRSTKRTPATEIGLREQTYAGTVGVSMTRNELQMPTAILKPASLRALESSTRTVPLRSWKPIRWRWALRGGPMSSKAAYRTSGLPSWPAEMWVKP